MHIGREVWRVPVWVRWIAQDSSGAWWGYSVEPLRHDNGWYENEVGCYLPLGTATPREWKRSLRAVCFPPGVISATFLPDSGGVQFAEQVS